jgi:hypothetical protein
VANGAFAQPNSDAATLPPRLQRAHGYMAILERVPWSAITDDRFPFPESMIAAIRDGPPAARLRSLLLRFFQEFALALAVIGSQVTNV